MNQVKEYRKLMEELEEKLKAKDLDVQTLQDKVRYLEREKHHFEDAALRYKEELKKLAKEQNEMKKAVQTTVKELAAFII